MAKIERKVQKIFGGNLSPAGNIAIYGTKEAGSPSFSDNVETIQSLSWLQGILGAVSPAKAPYIEDLNGVFYVITKQLAYLFQAGVAEWNSSTEYYTNSMCQYNGKIYVAIQNSTNQAPTQTAYWIEYTELFTKYLPTTFNSTVSSTIGGYPSGAILDYTDGSGSIRKIKSLINNNQNAPTEANVRISGSEAGTFYWQLVDTIMPSALIAWNSNVIPEGWLLCDGSEVSKTTYAFLYRMLGNRHGEATDNTKFKLPDYRNRTFWGGDTTNVGTVKDSALPNIKGNLGVIDTPNNTSGPFYAEGMGVGNDSNDYGNKTFYKFNASRSSAVYKDSQAIVQPPVIQTPVIIKY